MHCRQTVANNRCLHVTVCFEENVSYSIWNAYYNVFCHNLKNFLNKPKPFVDLKSLTGSLPNTEDPDEMPHNAAFHQGLHFLLRHNRSSEKKQHYFMKIVTCDPSKYKMDHHDFIVCSFMESSIGLKRVRGDIERHMKACTSE